MSREFEASAAGLGGRYKSIAKAPPILKPCEHMVEKEGLLNKKFILIHGAADGSTKVRQVKV